jgi:glycosyltransferase involved in cell wall biosynthesis
MKIIFNCHLPFSLAHGGAQIQIERTKEALGQLGVSVEPLRWWDEAQSGDILHHFGRIPTHLLRQSQEAGVKVVMSAFLTGSGARPAWQRFLHRCFVRVGRPALPKLTRNWLAWDSFRLADACIGMTTFEAALMMQIFRAPKERVHVIPNGVEDIFLREEPRKRGQWLVCTASIIEMKQMLKLSQMSVEARTPLWLIGRPLPGAEDYARAVAEFAKQHPDVIRYEGPISDREQLARTYREARGFVLLSRWEGLSLSALEAAACGCPLMLSDLPWAHSAFAEKATYCPHNKAVPGSAEKLRAFYDAAPQLEVPPKPASWLDVGRKLKSVYESVLRASP